MNNENGINEKRVDELMAAISLYTTQLEDYDKSNFSSCMTCIGFVGGLIAVVGAILCTSSNNSNSFLNEAVSVIILLIPLIVTLFLYNFSMNCRRSALFRGYVQFLEECLNQEIGKKDMLYSNFLIPEYYGKFKVNNRGPIPMIIFLIILNFFSFLISVIFAINSVHEFFLVAYIFGVVTLFVFCIVFDILYCVSLVQNGDVIKDIKNACINKNSMN